VSTPVNGIPELIEHGVTGLLATPGDVDSLSTQLERLLRNPELRQTLAEAARQKVTTNFHLENNVRHLGRLFEQFPRAV
jgi:glycosyltransferase involved in cell wall biosynthesis